jgi:uncharacterized repeat protein (TIGR01451 family)
MSLRTSLASMPRAKRGFNLFWTAILMLTLAFQYAAVATPRTALAAVEGCDSFAIWTTDVNGDTVNQNHYESKPEVYLNGGPDHGVGLVADTKLYYQVQEPDGTPLMEIRSIVLSSDGTFHVQLYPFDTTSNSGGEYKVVVSTEADLSEGGCTKSDNFKVAGPGSLKIVKDVDGGPANFSGDFGIHVNCGDAGSFNRTISFPDPGFVTIGGIDAKAHCTVSETDTPNPPAGYSWGDATFTGNPATIDSGKTVTVKVTNHLNLIPAPALTVDKGVSLSASGPFTASLTTTTGTTVHYRITVTNTGNVTLHGVTLSDNTFDLVAKGCTIPTTLAVGAHFDCDYTDVATTGTKTNIATGDSTETDSDTGTATVTAAPAAAPALNVEKSVALSASGPWVDQVTVQTGTTVFFKITVTNTGNTNLTAVTLSDNTYDLVAKGCTIPTTLAVGAHFDCAYSSVAVTGTTTNTATADSGETAPDTDTATVVATVTPPPAGLTIDKTNNAPLVNVGGTNIPTAEAGSTVTFTLTYTHTGSATADGTITDVLPVGLTYVTGSATGSADFSFDGYNASTRTLTWTADEGVSASGFVTYQAKVDADAAGEDQPLRNVAVIDSGDTESDTDTSEVFVPAPVLGETNNPGVPTAPQTDVLDSGATAAPGLNMGLVLVFLGIVTLALVFITPAPAAFRARNRRR